MPQPALAELPLGQIRPAGWLRRQLQLQADGLTGRLADIWPDVGPDNGWLGGHGDDWERGPYYLDGLLPLGYVLDDAGLIAAANVWVESMLASQRADGQFGPAGHDDWWSRMVAMKVLTQHADATGDPRVAPFLARYFRYQLEQLPGRPLEGWGRARGADNVLSVLWLQRHAPEPWLGELASLVLSQTDDWARFVIDELPPGPVPAFGHLLHGVNVAMGLKAPAVRYLCDGDAGHLAEVDAMWAHLDELHGLVHGIFSGDEWLGGRDPHHGDETCLVVELMYSLELIAAASGAARYGDLLEVAAFNLLAAACDPHMLGHQYHQQANQVLVSFAPRDWSFSGPDANVFGLAPHFGCCTANLHQGWPKFVRSLWMRSGPQSLTAVAYAPCTVEADIAGADVRLEVETDYPFDEAVHVTVRTPAPVSMELRLRVPGWCDAPSLVVVGDPVPVAPGADGYVVVERTWGEGDRLTLTLPMALRTVRRDRGAVGFRLGPLVMVHGVREIWRPVPDPEGLGEWEITPRGWWNLAPRMADPDSPPAWPVERRAVGPVPFLAAAAPVIVRAWGVPLPEWKLVDNSAGPPPTSPVTTPWPAVEMPLLPYGSARLRVAEMPTAAPLG